MKTLFFIPLLFVASGILAKEPGGPGSLAMDFDSAVKVLTTTRASRYSASLAIHTPNVQLNAPRLVEILQKQNIAVGTIHYLGRGVDLGILIPFLEFTPFWETRDEIHSTSMPMDQMEARRQKWPVFALILDMPKAAPSLEKYCMDQNNPAHCRVDALHVLTYLDKDRAKKAGDALTAEFQNTLTRSIYVPCIQSILKGAAGSGFDGPMDDLDNTGYDISMVKAF